MYNTSIAVVKTASKFLYDLGYEYKSSVVCENTIICKITREDAPTLMRMLKEAGYRARF